MFVVRFLFFFLWDFCVLNKKLLDSRRGGEFWCGLMPPAHLFLLFVVPFVFGTLLSFEREPFVFSFN